VDHIALSAGDFIFGIRTNSKIGSDLLRHHFASRVVDAPSPAPNYSIVIAEPTAHSFRPLHRLYESNCLQLSTSNLRNLFSSLWHELDAWDARGREELLVDATVVLRRGSAHVLEANLRRSIADARRRWEKDHLHLVDRRWFELNVSLGTLRIPGDSLVWDEDAILMAGPLWRRDPPNPWLCGNYEISNWLVGAPRSSLAARTMLAATAILDRQQHDVPNLITDLSILMARLAPVRSRFDSLEGLRSFFVES
jgi:hypothetical protein